MTGKIIVYSIIDLLFLFINPVNPVIDAVQNSQKPQTHLSVRAIRTRDSKQDNNADLNS